MKTVAVPTNFSFQTLRAMQLSLQLFPNDTIRFLLFSRSERPTDTQELLFLLFHEEALTVDSNEHFSEGLDLLTKRYAYQIESITHDHFWGSLAFVTRHLSDTQSIDLLLLPQSESCPDGGSKVSELIKINRCPLLLVPDAYTGEHPSKIGWVINQDFDPEVYERVSQTLTLLSDEKVETLFMTAVSGQGVKKLNNHLGALLEINRRLSFVFHHHRESNRVFIDTTISHQVDMIVLQQKSHWFSLKVKDPLIKDIVLLSPVPVLIFPPDYAMQAA